MLKPFGNTAMCVVHDQPLTAAQITDDAVAWHGRQQVAYCTEAFSLPSSVTAFATGFRGCIAFTGHEQGVRTVAMPDINTMSRLATMLAMRFAQTQIGHQLAARAVAGKAQQFVPQRLGLGLTGAAVRGLPRESPGSTVFAQPFGLGLGQRF